MTHDIMQAGDELGMLVNQLEAQLADAFRTCSRLSMTASVFGGEARVTPRLAQPIVQELGGAMAAIAQAQGHAIAAHRSAERVGKFIGYGDGMPKPDEAFFTGADAGHLSIVAQAA